MKTNWQTIYRFGFEEKMSPKNPMKAAAAIFLVRTEIFCKPLQEKDGKYAY